jgi:hypothetical protein
VPRTLGRKDRRGLRKRPRRLLGFGGSRRGETACSQRIFATVFKVYRERTVLQPVPDEKPVEQAFSPKLRD